MSTLEAPTIETFEPVKAYSKLGVAYISLCNPDGVRLELSEPGVVEVDGNPDVASLLARMGAFIAEHDGYKNQLDVRAAEMGRTLRVAEDKRKMRKLGYDRVRNASVYQHDSAPTAIVKAYDYGQVAAGFQFYMGAWLHDKLTQASAGISSPAQLAMFQASPFGHRTTVIDYVPGENLKLLGFKLRNANGVTIDQVEEIQAATIAAASLVRRRVLEATGWRGQATANDLRNPANIIVANPETVTPDNILDSEFAVVDQPVINIRYFGLQIAARYLPLLGGEAVRQPELAPSSTTRAT